MFITRIQVRRVLSVSDLVGLSKKADTMSNEEVRMAAIKNELKVSNDDQVLFNSFNKQYRSGKYKALIREYDHIVNNTSHWGIAIGDVPFSIETLNLVLSSMAVVTRQSKFSTNRAVTLYNKLIKNNSQNLPQANSESFEIFLKMLAQESSCQTPLWAKTVRMMRSRELRLTPGIYASGIQIYNKSQQDSRIVWAAAVKNLTSEELLDPRIILVASDSAERLNDASMMMNLLRMTIEGKKLNIRLVARFVKLLSQQNYSSYSEIEAVIEQLIQMEALFKSVNLSRIHINSGFAQQAMELCLSVLTSEKHYETLLSCVSLLYSLIELKHVSEYQKGLLLLAKVKTSPQDVKQNNFISGCSSIKQSIKTSRSCLWDHNNKINWFRQCCEEIVDKKENRNAVERLQEIVSDCNSNDVLEIATTVCAFGNQFEEGIQIAVNNVIAKRKESTSNSDELILPFLALLDGCKICPSQRQHDLIINSIKSIGLTPPVQCYNLCIILSCEADDLDAALHWLEILKQNNDTARTSPEAYTALIKKACVVGDGPLALSLMDTIICGGSPIQTETATECGNALATIDWRGECIEKFREKIDAHLEQLIEAKKYAFLRDIPKLT